MFEGSPTQFKQSRSPAAFTTSLLVHAGVGLILFNLALPQTAQRLGLRVVPVYAPVIENRKPAPARMITPPPQRLPIPRATVEILPPPLVLPSPRPEPTRSAIPDIAIPIPEVRLPDPIPPPIPTARPQPVPRVGAFDAPSAPPTPIANVAAKVRTSGFEQTMSEMQQMPRRDAVAPAEFGAVSEADRHARAAPRSASTSFGSVEAASPRVSEPPTVRKTEFAAIETRAAAAKPAVSNAPSAPLEILDKPRPAYSDEARKLKLEGVVVLEVAFDTVGKAHVLRVLRGLGHGLDETAMNAASGIRFRPAMEHGRPVDTVASVRIEFQLAY
jgi:TonB family protein